MTIGVDSRNNSIIVAAPEPLFKEVEQLVAQLDSQSTPNEEAVKVVSVKRANPALIKKVLVSVVGGASGRVELFDASGRLNRIRSSATLAAHRW